MKQTAVEWLVKHLSERGYIQAPSFGHSIIDKAIEQAKAIEREHMCDFADFVATYTDKNKNHEGDLLHAKSKYDGAERTIDLLEEYYKSKLNYSEK